MSVSSPRTAAGFTAYYPLYYAVLRAPWQQPPGSERAPDNDVLTNLHARAPVVPFEEAAGYAVIMPSHPLLGNVPYL